MYLECEKLEDGLPRFLRGFFSYLKGNVLPATRLAYLHDIMFFFKYLIEETDLTQAKTPEKILGIGTVQTTLSRRAAG